MRQEGAWDGLAVTERKWLPGMGLGWGQQQLMDRMQEGAEAKDAWIWSLSQSQRQGNFWEESLVLCWTPDLGHGPWSLYF